MVARDWAKRIIGAIENTMDVFIVVSNYSMSISSIDQRIVVDPPIEMSRILGTKVRDLLAGSKRLHKSYCMIDLAL